MEILDLVDGKPAGNGHHKTDFMNLRRLQPREKLANAQASHATDVSLGSTISFAGSWTCCPIPTASGLSMIVPNGFALRRTFLILVTRRVMASTRR